MSTERLVFNGINGASGDYLLPPMTPQQVSQIARGEPQDPEHLRELKAWFQRTTQATLGPKEGVDPKNLAETGWGVIFAYEDRERVPAIREALGEREASSLPEYIQANSYPREIRKTLRDAVTYLFVEMLADTSLWRPEQSNEIYRLDFQGLLRGDVSLSRGVSLEDPAVHPLIKICALLDDLGSLFMDFSAVPLEKCVVNDLLNQRVAKGITLFRTKR